MELKAAVKIDLKQRFRKELLHLPKKISLQGNAMHTAIAKQLITTYAPHHFEITSDGAVVQLMSLEAYGTAFVRALLGEQPRKGLFLLHTIPEAELLAYAKRHSIPVVAEEKDDVRTMIERIAAQQPQTFFSLLRSAERLSEHFRTL